MTAFTHLMQPLRIRGCTLKNRIMSTGHDTTLPVDGTVNAALVAYQEARARGGVGLIVLQVSGVHETARYTNHVLMATDDDAIAGYRSVAQAVHRHGTVLFGQLFHPGREIAEADGGLLSVAYAPSAVPNERFHVMPRALKQPLLDAIVHGYGDAARRMQTAGLDGVEIVASHGYLPAQFLNPRVNLRDDAYGGDWDGRLRFLREVIADIRAKVTDGFVVGMRISGSEADEQGLTEDETFEAVTRLDDSIDYVHITVGTSASLGGAIHIAPPMAFKPGYVVPYGARIKRRSRIPVFVTGRINQPQDAEARDRRQSRRRLRHDAGPDMRSGNAEQDRSRGSRGYPRLHRLQSGLHRAFPQGIRHLLHPESGERARIALGDAAAGRTPQASHDRRRRARRNEGGGHRG